MSRTPVHRRQLEDAQDDRRGGGVHRRRCCRASRRSRTSTSAICPPYLALQAMVDSARGSRVQVYAQNMHEADSGAFTGEVSAPMLTEIDVHGVVLGHSERRQYFSETDRALQQKVPAGARGRPDPDPLRRRDRGGARARRHRAQAAPPGPGGPREGRRSSGCPRSSIAYEPIWAIGTGLIATPEQAQEAVAFVRALVEDFDKAAGQAVRILYGGSLKPDNAAELLALPDVDGALVGGATPRAGLVRGDRRRPRAR